MLFENIMQKTKKIYPSSFYLVQFHLRKCSTGLQVPITIIFWDAYVPAVPKCKTVSPP